MLRLGPLQARSPAPLLCARQQGRIGRSTTPVCASKSRRSQSSRDRSSGLDPMLEAAVPVDQRPVNELQQLKGTFLTSWASMPLPEYLKRLSLLFAGAFALLGGPVAAQTYVPAQEPVAFAAAATLGGLLVVGVASLRMYLGWKYVGGRLSSASYAYEETGWYDGQIFTKPPEVLMRDRLLSIYEVKPVLARVERTLQVAGAGLATIVLALVLMQGEHPAALQDATGRRVPASVTPSGIIFSPKVKDLSELANDDEAAEAEALAQGGVPGYCGDRYYRAAAGGQYCKKFDAR